MFVDADVVVEPCAFTSSVALLRRTGLDLLSPYPRQIAVGIGRAAGAAAAAVVVADTLPLGLAERSAAAVPSRGERAFLVVDAPTYRRAGGHAAVRDEVLEDIALLRAVKRAGGTGRRRTAPTSPPAGCTTAGRSCATGTPSRCGPLRLRAGVACRLALLVADVRGPPLAALSGSRVGRSGTSPESLAG